MQITHSVPSLEAMLQFGQRLGRSLKGGEIFELVGDVGTGKTTFVKGLAKGLDVTDVVQSPTFTISRVYEARNGLSLLHYDFYRLSEPGIMRDELAESLQESTAVIALEWDQTVHDLLPQVRTLRLEFSYAGEEKRQVLLTIPTELEYMASSIEEQ